MSNAREHLLRVRDNINEVLIGNPDATALVLIALITGGHVLLEDMPGTGKTTLARLLARSFDTGFGYKDSFKTAGKIQSFLDCLCVPSFKLSFISGEDGQIKIS